MNETPILRWKERSGVYDKPAIIHYSSSVGLKFKKKNDFIQVRSKHPELKGVKNDLENLKIESVSMIDGICIVCSKKEYDGKKVDRIETYAYATYAKDMPNLFNLSY